MHATLHLSLIQSNLYWENSTQNRLQFESYFQKIGKTDVIILPEMFTTGFTMNTAIAETVENSPTLEWLNVHAAKLDAMLMGSLIIEENGHYFNRLYAVEPSGKTHYYDKRHLFRMADEHHHFSVGTQRIIIEYKGWRICPQICYDLRFPVWSRNMLQVDQNGQTIKGYDVLVYVANFPAARASAWNILLPARAIENAAYCVGVNRVGTDGKQIAYSGNSAVYDFKGTQLIHSEQEDILQVSLSAEELKSYRQKFAVYLDADSFLIQ